MVYLLRPSIVLPDAVGAKELVPGRLAPLVHRLGEVKQPVPIPVITAPVPIQFIHQDHVGQAFLLCIVGTGPPGTYNITGDGVLSGAQLLGERGFDPIPAPPGLMRTAARGVAALPFMPPFAAWTEALTHAATMDASKAKRELGWRPRYSSLEALRDTLDGRPPERGESIVMGRLRGSASAEIDAPLLEVWAVVEDVLSAPEWQGGLDKITAIECDAEGRPTLVETENDIKVRRIKSRVRIRYDGPTRLSFTQEKGDMKSVEGVWELQDLGHGRTRASYRS